MTEVAREGSVEKPQLVFFHSRRSGRCRRVEAMLAQALVRRRNHETFVLYRIDIEEKPELATRFSIQELPTLLVVEGRRVRARLELAKGRPSRALEAFLAPWLS
jgi:thioredoxin-like negative regulator of GroEL